MDAKAKFEQYVKENGLRRTDQREQILGVFLSTERHVTTQELYDMVRKKYRGIGYATVARTMKLLSEAGLCREVDFGDGVQRYEHKYGHEHHDHLICVRCGKFMEIYNKKLEKLQTELVREHGYSEVYHKLEIFGVCPCCGRGVKRSR